MLRALRKKKNAKKVLWLLAMIIIPAFIFLGNPRSSLRRRETGNYAGIIFGKRIDFKEFNDAYKSVRNQAIMQFGDEFYKIEKFLNLKEQAWDRILLLYDAKRKKISVDDERVIEIIENYPFFKSKGKFSRKLYKSLLEYPFRTTAREFEEETRKSLIIAELFENLTKDIAVADEELLKKYKQENELVKIEYLYLLADSLKDEVTLKEEELENYFNKNPSRFKYPETVNVEYVIFNVAQDSSEEKSALEDKIKDKAARLKNPQNFEKVARELGLNIKETGFLSRNDPIPGIGWSQEFLNTAFNLKKNEISDLVYVTSGICILKLKEKRAPFIPDFNDVKDKVKEKLSEEKSLELAEDRMNIYYKDILRLKEQNPNISLSEISKKIDLAFEETPKFKRADYIPKIGISKEFTDTAFSLKNKEISPIIKIKNGFYVLMQKEFFPIDEERFQKERQDFSRSLLQKKKDSFFKDYVSKLRRASKIESNI